MLVNFENFIVMLGVVWVVGEVLITALKDKLHIDKMLYSVCVFGGLGVFSLVYDGIANNVVINQLYVINCIVYLALCIVIPLVGYDTLIELIKRIKK